MRAFVTGGTGFIGGAVARKLLAAGHSVRALVRPAANTMLLDGLPVERIEGDLQDYSSLQRGIKGCDWVFHVAALYSFWGHAWSEFNTVNVDGTRNVLQAAREAGVPRVVYTSSIAVLKTPRPGAVSTEDDLGTLADMIVDYKRSKFLAEAVARDFAAQGLPVVIVNPSTPVGIGDVKPTPSGKIVVDFLNGRMPAYVDTGLNLVDVDDVAAGHLLAAERGRVGERYILGGENLTLKQVLDLLAQVSGLPPVNLHIPHAAALAWSYIDVTIARLNPRYTPSATPGTARLSRNREHFDSSKAVRELGFPHTPVREALRKAVEWYRAHGYASQTMRRKPV